MTTTEEEEEEEEGILEMNYGILFPTFSSSGLAIKTPPEKRRRRRGREAKKRKREGGVITATANCFEKSRQQPLSCMYMPNHPVPTPRLPNNNAKESKKPRNN